MGKDYASEITQTDMVDTVVPDTPLLGHGQPEQTDILHGRPGAEPVAGTATVTPEIYRSNVFDAFQGMDADQRKALAMDIFVNVPGAYRDVEDVFTEAGDVNEPEFVSAFWATMGMAEQYGPDQLGSGTDGNSQYIDILMGDRERTPTEIAADFARRKAEIEAEKNAGKGRVINYIDPVALAASAKQAFSSVTGRKATVAEQQAFVKQIHGLQATGATGISVGARAEQFAANQAPVEAGAMDYANSANLLMKAMGLG